VLAERAELEHNLRRQERWTVRVEETSLEETEFWRFGERVLLGLDNSRDHRNAQAWGRIDHHAGAIAVDRLSCEGHASAARWDHVLQDHSHTRRNIRLAYLLPIGHRTFRPPRGPAGLNVGPEFVVRYL
jgi:hypothetical protein